MTLSAAFTINGTPVPASVSLAYAATVNLALTSLSDVRTIEWTIPGTSKSNQAAPTITPAGVPLGATASFALPADPGDGLGRAFLVKVRVTDGRGNSLAAYGIVGTTNSQNRMPFASGEELARHGTHGWTDDINALVNLAAGGSGGWQDDGSIVRLTTAADGAVLGSDTLPAGVGAAAGSITQVSDQLSGARGVRIVQAHNTSASAGAVNTFWRSRGTLASPLTVTDGDTLAILATLAHDGTNYVSGPGQLAFVIEGTVGTNTLPTMAIIRTGTVVTPLDRLSIFPNGSQLHNTDSGGSYEWDHNGTAPTILSSSTLDLGSKLLATIGNLQLGADPAQAGRIRLTNNDAIFFRNNANDNNIRALLLDSSDHLYIGNNTATGPVQNVYNVRAAGGHFFQVDGVAEATLSASALDLQNNDLITTGQIHQGATLPSAGDYRAKHAWSLQGVASGGSGDRNLLDWGVTTTDVLTMGGSTHRCEVRGNSSGLRIFSASVERVRIAGAIMDLNNGTNANYQIQGNAEVMLGLNIAASGVRNLAFFNDGSANMQSMDGGVYFLNAVAVPSGNPTGGGFMYAEGGAGKWRGSGGTVTTFGPAEPHCPRCGRDFAIEHENPKYGKQSICLWCMVDALNQSGISESRYVIERKTA